ncbi:MAG: hypothetical protein AB8B63_24515 [Granulosicoccus sp.]
MTTEHSLDTAARAILVMNDKGSYTIPTAGLYPYQWNWDSAFAAFGFAQFDIARAWTELDTLFASQWSSGMVPHIIFHTIDPSYFPGPDVWGGVGPVPSSGISQPPIAASMARLIFDRNPQVGLERMAPLFDRMVAWHGWFMDWRLDRGAVCITHPWEAGRDNAPDWDIAMQSIDPVGVGEYQRRDTSHVDSSMRPTKKDYDRYLWLVNQGRELAWDDASLLEQNPFRVADPSMTFTLLRAMRDLFYLGVKLGRETASIERWITELENGAETLWNAELGSYDSRDVRSGQWSRSISNASFLCWYAGVDRPEMKTQYHDITQPVKYGVPSYDPRAPGFDARRYWRGPVWAIMNMLISMGMEECGMSEGQALRESTQALISEHGFAEYFDPRDGSPAGGENFTWTAAVWLGWASPAAEWS